MKHKRHFILLFLGLLGITNIRAQVINAGVGGNNTINLLKRLDTDVLQQNPDLLVLMVGTNDMLNSRKMISYKTYGDNLKEIVQKTKEMGAKIILMSPPPADSTYLYQRHDRKLYAEIPNVKLDSARQIVAKVAKENSLGCIDLFQIFSEMGLPKHNEDLFFRNERNSGAKDGVHPTNLGYQFIAEVVFDYLKSNNLLEKNQKIVCFGDSITNGAGTKNRGSIIGKNYPAVLSQLILEHFQD